jgi:hypothetical protein
MFLYLILWKYEYRYFLLFLEKHQVNEDLHVNNEHFKEDLILHVKASISLDELLFFCLALPEPQGTASFWQLRLHRSDGFGFESYSMFNKFEIQKRIKTNWITLFQLKKKNIKYFNPLFFFVGARAGAVQILTRSQMKMLWLRHALLKYPFFMNYSLQQPGGIFAFTMRLKRKIWNIYFKRKIWNIRLKERSVIFDSKEDLKYSTQKKAWNIRLKRKIWNIRLKRRSEITFRRWPAHSWGRWLVWNLRHASVTWATVRAHLTSLSKLTVTWETILLPLPSFLFLTSTVHWCIPFLVHFA